MIIVDVSGIAHWKFNQRPVEERVPANMLDDLETWFDELAHAEDDPYLVAAFDGANNFRKLIDPQYKAHRPPTDPALSVQMREMKTIINAMGFACISVDGYEADDIAATLVKNHAFSQPIKLVSNDKDWSQLLIDNVKLFSPRADAEGNRYYVDADGWTERFGVPPHRMQEFLGLAGDAGDGVSGVSGWGAGSAKKAIAQTNTFGDILRFACMRQLQGITTARQDYLVTNKAMSEYTAARKLTTLVYDVEFADSELKNLKREDVYDHESIAEAKARATERYNKEKERREPDTTDSGPIDPATL